jgi:hypothetical protein
MKKSWSVTDASCWVMKMLKNLILNLTEESKCWWYERWALFAHCHLMSVSLTETERQHSSIILMINVSSTDTKMMKISLIILHNCVITVHISFFTEQIKVQGHQYQYADKWSWSNAVYSFQQQINIALIWKLSLSYTSAECWSVLREL